MDDGRELFYHPDQSCTFFHLNLQDQTAWMQPLILSSDPATVIEASCCASVCMWFFASRAVGLRESIYKSVLNQEPPGP